MNKTIDNQSHAFESLTPDTVLSAVENALGVHYTNLCSPMNSYINRVYELKSKDGIGHIAKFYRPGRWSKDTLQDEHDFLLELAEAEIPVITPMQMENNKTLGKTHGIYFAIFPKKGGRSFDEFTDQQWPELGRLLGRVHMVGEKHSPRDRVILTPGKSTQQNLEYILKGGFIPDDLIKPFEKLTEQLINEIEPLFDQNKMIRIHGDCHFSNLMYRPGEGMFLIDLDDMAVGPPVQDFWMLLPGFLNDSLAEVDLFLEGYEVFRNFDKQSLRLIEPLRAMRFIHYMTWCAHQAAEDGLSRVSSNFGSHEYWQQEITDLSEQLDRIKNSADQAIWF